MLGLPMLHLVRGCALKLGRGRSSIDHLTDQAVDLRYTVTRIQRYVMLFIFVAKMKFSQYM